MIPPPPVARLASLVAAVAWLALVIVSAVVGAYKGFVPRLAGTLLDTAATVAFATAGLGLITERWQRREWERRTGPVVRMLVDRALGPARRASLSSPSWALPELQRVQAGPIEPAFRLPFDQKRRVTLLRAQQLTTEVMNALQLVADVASGSTWKEAKENLDRALPDLEIRDDLRPPFTIERTSLLPSNAIRQHNADEITAAFERTDHVIAELVSYTPDNAESLVTQFEQLRTKVGEPIDDRKHAMAPVDTASDTYREAKNAITLVAESYEGFELDHLAPPRIDSIYRTRTDGESAIDKVFNDHLDESENLQEMVWAQTVLPTARLLESTEKFFEALRATPGAGESAEALAHPEDQEPGVARSGLHARMLMPSAA